ncbi:MAG TPA: DUF1579 family protein [Candidatus Acidoferrales bacterium]|nr:DUF1579 family protein [Candidatus Acidoferrales bacterium]
MSEQKTSFGSRAGVIAAAVIGFLCGAILFVSATALAAHRTRGVVASAEQMGGQAGPNDAEHQSLAKLAGEYDRVIKFVGQTGAMAQPSSGTCTFSVELGGRFIVEKSHDVVFGRPVDGLRIYGYNDKTKEYEMARLYTMSNGITLMKGTSSDGGKTIDYVGEGAGMGAGGAAPLKAKFVQLDADRFTVTMSTTDANGKDMPFQETDYTRKK